MIRTTEEIGTTTTTTPSPSPTSPNEIINDDDGSNSIVLIVALTAAFVVCHLVVLAVWLAKQVRDQDDDQVQVTALKNVEEPIYGESSFGDVK